VLVCLLGEPWELGQFLRVAIGIAASVGHLHQRGLVHKDVKPANIFVNTLTDEAWLSGFNGRGNESSLP
jgi:serine/threonine protein kinase